MLIFNLEIHFLVYFYRKNNLKNTELKKSTFLLPFILVTSLFFMWGIANSLNGILIPHLRKALQLTNTQSAFVDVAIYFAYFLTAIPAGIILKKIGYKKGIILGLVVFSIGSLLFIPAANTQIYNLFLLGLFIIGCGLTILETAANPYATLLGEPESATSRLNLAQSFNGFAVFIGPVLGTKYILSGTEYTEAQLNSMDSASKIVYFTAEAASVKLPYGILGICLLILALFITFFKFPEFKINSEQKSEGSIAEAFRFGHLRWAMIAQFFYLGAQLCTTSFFIRMAMKGGLSEKTAGYYLGIYGLLFMIGRFFGTFLMRKIEPSKLLSIYAIINILLTLLAVLAPPQFVVYALGGVGFFLSIMFPTIFSLGINGLGKNTKAGSSLIVMAIIGGAIFPVLMGKIIDIANDNIQLGYLVPLVCYSFILYFGLKGHKANSIISNS